MNYHPDKPFGFRSNLPITTNTSNLHDLWNNDSSSTSRPYTFNNFFDTTYDDSSIFGMDLRGDRTFDKQSPALNFSDIHLDDDSLYNSMSKTMTGNTDQNYPRISNCDGVWRPMRNVPVQRFFMRHKKANDDQEWINEEKTFAFVLYEKIKLLSNKAEKEDWGHQLQYLAQYLDHTYRRAAELSNDSDTFMGYYPAGSDVPTHCCFHTGLLTPSVEFLYALLTLNAKQSTSNPKWFLYTFQTANTMINAHKMRLYHEIAPFMENALPAKVTYWRHDPNEMYFNPSIRIEDIDLSRTLADDPQDPEKKKKLLLQFKSMIDVQNRFLIGFSKSKTKVEAEPRLAIPQYFRLPEGHGELHLLIPIILEYNHNQPDYALVLKLERTKTEQFYRVVTFLTKEQCYVNARLIQRIDETWLSPQTFRQRLSNDRPFLNDNIQANVIGSKGFEELIKILKQYSTQSEKPPELAQIAGQLKQIVPSLNKGKGQCKRYITKASEAGVVKLIEKGKQIYIILEE